MTAAIKLPKETPRRPKLQPRPVSKKVDYKTRMEELAVRFDKVHEILAR